MVYVYGHCIAIGALTVTQRPWCTGPVLRHFKCCLLYFGSRSGGGGLAGGAWGEFRKAVTAGCRLVEEGAQTFGR